MKTIILIAVIAAVVGPIYAEDAALETKKQDKRGVVGLGYGGYYNGLGGYSGYGGYSGHQLASPYVSTYAHAPAVSYANYANLGGYQGSPYYTSPLRLGYGYSGLGYGNYHGLGAYNGYAGLGHGIGYAGHGGYLNGAW